jgi:hypothetical protein
MNIILEGVDASGKSTLATELAKNLRRSLIVSEGPEKDKGEIIRRIARYETYTNCIFDRHPIISHPIYSQFTPWMTRLSPMMLRDFYSRPHIIVYCQPTPEGFSRHIEGEHDTAEHVELVSKNYQKFLADYNEWALRRAHVVYRCGERFEHTLNFLTAIGRNYQ